MKYAALVLVLLPLTAVAGERASIVVCPPNLSYCYHEDRPVLSRKRDEDAFREAEQWLEMRKEEVRVQHQRNMDGLLMIGR